MVAADVPSSQLMAIWQELRAVALALPEVSEDDRLGPSSWHVSDELFVLERAAALEGSRATHWRTGPEGKSPPRAAGASRRIRDPADPAIRLTSGSSRHNLSRYGSE